MANSSELSDGKRKRLEDAWKVGEGVAMHFNDLLLGFRLKAIGGIAVAAVVGIGLKVGDFADPFVVLSLFVGLLVIWGLVWAVDFLYYYRLLAGAVDELLRLEKELGDLHLSHLIERRVRGGGPPKNDINDELPYQPRYASKYPSWPIWVFYGLPALILVTMAIWLPCTASGEGKNGVGAGLSPVDSENPVKSPALTTPQFSGIRWD